MGLFDLFSQRNTGDTSDTAVVQGFWLGSMILDYSRDNYVYYKFYRENPFVRSCIDEIRKTAGKHGIIGLVGEKEVDTQEIRDLFSFTSWSFENFLKTLIRDFEITHNAYVYRVTSDMGAFIGFQLLDPRTIKPVGNSFGEVLYYEQRVWANTVKLAPEEVYHLMDDPNPDNIYIGTSKLEALTTELRTDKEAANTWYSFFTNNGIPSFIIKLKDGAQQTVEKLKDMKELIAGGNNRGGSNKYRGYASDAIEGIETVQNDLSDMKIEDIRKFTLELVCSVYWVPKSVLNFTEGVNYTNWDTQYRQFIQETIIPLEHMLEQFLTKILKAEGYDIEIQFVQKHIDLLEQKSEMVEKLVNGGIMTPDEAREMIGLEAMNTESSNILREEKKKEEKSEKQDT